MAFPYAMAFKPPVRLFTRPYEIGGASEAPLFHSGAFVPKALKICLTWLAGLLCAGHLSHSVFASVPPTLNHRNGGSITLDVPGIRNGMQFALSPGGAHLGAVTPLQGQVQALVTDGDNIFVAAGEEGLLVFDTMSGSTPRLLSQLKWQGKIDDVTVRDGYAYLTDSPGAMLILDVSDPHQPKQIASIALASTPDAMYVDRGRVYWVSGKHFGILDVSQPQAPKQLAEFPLDSAATAIQVADGYAYLSQPKTGLLILDVRDPANIRESARFRGQVKDVTVAQGKAYLANGATGVTVLDVSDPQAPRWLGSANNLGDVLALRYDDGYVALRNERSEITLLDVHRADLPRVVAVLALDCPLSSIAFTHMELWAGTETGFDSMDFSAPAPNIANIGANFGGSRRAVIRDNILFVADWFSGLHLYDISDPASPRHLANYHTQGSSKGVLVRGDYAFVADDDHGVQILDIKNPKQPRKISEVATPGLAYTMKLVGDYLYLADHRGGFLIISVADIAHPAVVGSAATAGKAWAVDVVNDLAYVAADSAGLLVFDISDPRHPKQLAAYDVGGAAEDVVIRDHLAYVASFDNGLHIFDLSQPLQAREISHLATPGNARGIELAGDLAYIADWTSGIQIVNVADPAHPVTVGAYDTMGWSWGVRVQGHYAYVLDWWGGIVVLDISDPTTPTLAGAYQARGLTRDVVVRDSYAYVADGTNGLQIFDVKNPLNPIWMSGVDMTGDAQSVCLAGKTAYLATGADGVVTVDISNPFEPKWLGQTQPQANLLRASGDLTDSAGRQRCVPFDTSAGKQAAGHAAMISDMQPALNRMLLATADGVEILDAHQRPVRKLPQHADLLRLQNNLLAIYDNSTGIALFDYPSLNLLSRFNPGEEVSDLEISGKHLYASGSVFSLMDIDVSNVRHPVLKAAYTLTGRSGKLSVFSGSVFMAGNETLAEVRLLPDTRIKPDLRQQKVAVTVPKDMPLGSYNLLALDPRTGTRTMYYDVLRIVMPPPKKPRFTMQDLERELRKRGLKPRTYP